MPIFTFHFAAVVGASYLVDLSVNKMQARDRPHNLVLIWSLFNKCLDFASTRIAGLPKSILLKVTVFLGHVRSTTFDSQRP